MMKIILCCCLLAVPSTIFCQARSANNEKGLKDYYAQIFTIGVPVSPRDLKGTEASLILKHFGSLTPENVMKMGPIHPDDYNKENPGKREHVYNLLKKLVDASVPIDGVGLQGHWSLSDPTEGDL